jgi:hypothetical protein
VALVEAATGAPPDRTWRRGAKVQGNLSLKPGTAIATFGLNGRYGNTEDGASHAAVYLSQDAGGIWVIDQWNKRTNGKITGKQVPHKRHIRFVNPGAQPADTGSQFYVVE